MVRYFWNWRLQNTDLLWNLSLFTSPKFGDTSQDPLYILGGGAKDNLFWSDYSDQYDQIRSDIQIKLKGHFLIPKYDIFKKLFRANLFRGPVGGLKNKNSIRLFFQQLLNLVYGKV